MWIFSFLFIYLHSLLRITFLNSHSIILIPQNKDSLYLEGEEKNNFLERESCPIDNFNFLFEIVITARPK